MGSHSETGGEFAIGKNPTLFRHGKTTYVATVVGGIEARFFPTGLLPRQDVRKIRRGVVPEVIVFFDGLRTVGMRVK